MKIVRGATCVLSIAFGVMILACGGTVPDRHVDDGRKRLDRADAEEANLVQELAPDKHIADRNQAQGVAAANAFKKANPGLANEDDEDEFARPQADLIIESWSFTREHGFVHVRGEVTNLTTRRLENVTAVASFYTRDGTFVKSDSSIVEFNPIMPRQTTPFHVLDTDNPEIRSARVSFKYLFGEKISTVERTDIERDERIEKATQIAIRLRERAAELAEEQEKLMARRQREAPKAWADLQPVLEDGLTLAEREKVKDFATNFDGTDEASLALRELEADAKLRVGKRYLGIRVRDKAEAVFQEVVAEWPQTTAATEARLLLGIE